MQLVEFVATEHIQGEIELDWDTEIDEEDAKDLAIKEISSMYPEYDNIVIIRHSEF